MKLTTEDVSAFFAHKGASEACPFCGNVEWFYDEDMEFHLPTGPSDLARRASQDNKLYGGGTRSMLSSVIIMCLKCGFIRPHARRLIENWVSQKEGRPNDNDE